MAEGILILGVARGEERLQQALHLPQVLQALGDLCQPLDDQWLHLFTEGHISRVERQQGAYIIERKPRRLCGTNKMNDLKGLFGIEPILVIRPRGGTHQARAFVVAQRSCRHTRRARQLTNRVLLVHNRKPFITMHSILAREVIISLSQPHSDQIPVSSRYRLWLKIGKNGPSRYEMFSRARHAFDSVACFDVPRSQIYRVPVSTPEWHAATYQ